MEKPLVQKDAPPINPEKVTAEGAEIAQNQEPFDQSKLQEVLDRVIQEYKKEGKNMEVTVIRQPFEVNGDKVVFLLNGEIEKDIFLKIRQELTESIRVSLQNRQVEISCQITEHMAGPSSKLYTSTDKLRYLREKSPALKELQQRFGLETDF